MTTTDKHLQTFDFKVNKDFGEEEEFFRIDTGIGEVQLKKLPFQILQPLPDSINCRVKNINGTPQISHNMLHYINEFYADGFSLNQEFEFKVVGRPRDNSGFYRLEDENGLSLVMKESNAPFALGQTVKCKFEVLNPSFYILRRSNSDSLLHMYKIHELLHNVGISQSATDRAENQLRDILFMRQALEEHDHGYSFWIFTAIKAIRENLTKWFVSAVQSFSPEIVKSVLIAIQNITKYLLEESGFLRNIKGEERTAMQDELTRFIEFIDNYVEAHNIYSHRGQKTFVNNLLSHLKESGYVYHPESRFAIMMILFRLSPELINDSLRDLFDALMGWDIENWRMGTFRQAFVYQLEIFISEMREDIERYLTPETIEENQKIEKLLKAIAIQNALSLPDDNIDLRLNMSFFYRCLSLLRSAKSDVLLHKSFLSLMNVKLPIDFTWNDIKVSNMMIARAAVNPPATAALPEESRFFVSDKMVELEINDKGLCLSRTDDEAMGQIPNGMFSGMGLQVCTHMSRTISHTKFRTIEGHAEFWNELETSLFQPKDIAETFTGVKRTPDIDDIVRIEIDRVISPGFDKGKVEYFHCNIVDEHFIEGEGIMLSTDLVGYNLHGISAGTFRHVNGQPMQFDAVVVDIDDNDVIHFSLRDAAEVAMRDVATCGEHVRAVVTKDNGVGKDYSAISEKGFGLFIKKDQYSTMHFRSGDVVMVQITGFDSNNIYSVAEEGPLVGQTLTNSMMLKNILKEISIPLESEEDNELDIDEDTIPANDVKEIIKILRYKALSVSENIIMAYDYLSYAYLLARLIGAAELKSTIKAHKEILLLYQHYAKNKSIFIEDVEKIKKLSVGNIFIERLAYKLRLVSALGQTDQNITLWKASSNALTETDRKLAQMVLSYNLLTDSSAEDNISNQIKDNIAKLLNVSSEQRKLKYYGSESQYAEYKSSLVYPAQKGKNGISMADPDKQEYEILHIIAGFLNSKGGTLYIGVGDDRYEKGLDDDFKFYQIDKSERNNSYRRKVKTLDNMANYLQNRIDEVFSLGANAGWYADCMIDDDATKDVLMVKVRPCPHPVYFDNQIFVRHGAKTMPLIKDEEINRFLQDRPLHYRQLTTADLQEEKCDEEPPIPVVSPSHNANETETAESLSNDYESENDKCDNLIQQEDIPYTSKLRRNLIHEYLDPEHFATPSFYIAFKGNHDYFVTDDEWSLDDPEVKLSLAVLDDEADQHLLLVYEGEAVVKVPMREILKKKKNISLPYYSDKQLIMAVPIKSTDYLYAIHLNSKGTLYERLTSVESIPTGSMGTAPTSMLSAECVGSPFWEIVPESHAQIFEKANAENLKKSQIGALIKRTSTSKVTLSDSITTFYDLFK